MQRVVWTAFGFLLTETECERSLGADTRSSMRRTRLHPTTRRAALKVIADGVPMEELQAPSVEGAKAPYLWKRALEKYAELLGTKTNFARTSTQMQAPPGSIAW